jgi:putative PIN family toxin of toxin-antitoxin system
MLNRPLMLPMISFMRVVIDTDVMVATFESPTGASRRLVSEVLEGRVTLLLSTSLMLEYEDVLTRSQTLARSRLTVGEVLEVLDELARICLPVGFDYRWRPAARDPDDDLVLETAINGSADVIATFNAKDTTVGAKLFGIAVERPGTVLRRLE